MNPISRNDPCPCGSGLKFKKCCLQKSSNPLSDDDEMKRTRNLGVQGHVPRKMERGH